MLIRSPSLVKQGRVLNLSSWLRWWSWATSSAEKSLTVFSTGLMTIEPSPPSKASMSPSWISWREASPTQIAGIKRDRARIAACDTTPPLEVIIPLIFVLSMRAISLGRTCFATRIPSLSVISPKPWPKWCNNRIPTSLRSWLFSRRYASSILLKATRYSWMTW